MSTFIQPTEKAPDSLTEEQRAKLRESILATMGPKPLTVVITHVPFEPWFTLEFGGQTEELEHEQALKWFQDRGAKDMEKVNDAICQAFNFHKAEVTISAPKTPAATPGSLTGVEPRI